MAFKFVKKAIISFLILLVSMLIVGSPLKSVYKDYKSHIVQAEEKIDNGKKSEKKDKNTKKSYASLLFDKTDSNESMMYYKNQTASGVPTVESTIDEKSGQGLAYASYLNSLNQWNLYNTYTSQMDAGLGVLVSINKFVYGGILLLCLYLMDGIDGLIKITAQLLGHLNIFKYMLDSQGDIPKGNPFHVLQPVVDIFKQITVFAKIVLAILLAVALFRVGTGFGQARRRGSYFGRKFTRIVLGWMTIAFVPLGVSAFFGLFSDIVLSSDHYTKNTINDKPADSIVDTRGYIDASLTKLKDQKDNGALNDGFVLMHDGFPTTKKEVDGDVPTPKFVNYLNTGNLKGKDKPDGKDLLFRWVMSDTFTANDVDSMYNLSKKDKHHTWAFWENDEKRAFQFKLSPGPTSVKTFDGKDPISLDLNAVSINSATLAGNGPIGIFLNGLKMGITILGTTLVVLILVISMFRTLVKSTGLIFANIGLASFASPRALMATLATLIMLAISWVSVLMILPIYSEVTGEIDNLISDSVNDGFDVGGIGKQVIITAAALFVQWFSAILTIKGRGAIMNGVEDAFKDLLNKMSMYAGGGGSMQRGVQSGAQALNDMKEADQAPSQRSLDAMTAPLERSKDAIASAPGLALGYGKDKLSDASQSIKEAGQEKGRQGVEKAKEAAANFKSKMSTEDEVKDPENQGEDIGEKFAQGIEKMNTNSTSKLNDNFDNQGKSVENAIEKQSDLDDAKQELEDAENHYEQLKEAGASKAELAQAQDAIGVAEQKYNKALAGSQKSASDMVESGAALKDVSDAKQASAKDFNDASKDVISAEKDLESLRNEKQDMIRAGATGEDLVDINNDIQEAENRLSTAQDRQELAKEANMANVGNAQQEKDLRNDVIAARQSERAAEQQIELAEMTGNLSPQEEQTFRSTASSMSGNIESLQGQTRQELQNAEIARGALEFMSKNHNQAFTAEDSAGVSNFVDSAADHVQVAKSQLDQAKKSGATKKEISNLSQRVMDANKMKAGAETVMGAIESGVASSEAITAQEQIVSNVMEQKSQAEAQMADLQEASANGTVSRESYQSARNNLDNVTQSAKVATKTLSGLHALKAAGTNQMTTVGMEQAKQNVQEQIQSVQTKADTLNDASDVIRSVSSGGYINKDNVAKLVKAQSIAQEQVGAQTEAARDNYNQASTKLNSLKTQLANGKPVSNEIKRMQMSVDQAEEQLNNVENKEQAIRTSTRTFRRTGKTILSNIKEAKDNFENATNIKEERSGLHKEALHTGGYTKDQLSELQKDIETNKNDLNQNAHGFKRENRQRMSDLESAMKKGQDLMNINDRK